MSSPDIDEQGWDLVVEFSPEDLARRTDIPLDKYPNPLKCFLQVKATDSADGTYDVKLSNWNRFARLAAPCFFIVLDYGGQDVVQDAYVVHIGEELLTRLLERLRRMPPEGGNQLNKKTMRFRYGEEHTMEELTGECLRRHLLDPVRQHSRDYGEWKREVIESAGYEGHTASVKAEIKVPEAYRDQPKEFWLDHTLGLIPELEVERAEIRDIRFGIESQEPLQLVPEGSTLELKPESREAILAFSRKHEGELLRIPCEVHVPPNLEEGEAPKKFRLSLPYGDIVADTRQSISRFEIEIPPPDEEISLKRHKQIADLLMLLHESASEENNLTLSLRGEENSGLLGYLQFEGSADWAAHDVSTARLILDAWAAAKYFDIQDEVVVSGRELVAQKKTIQIVSALVTPTPDRTKGTVRIEVSPRDTEESSEGEDADADAEEVIAVTGGGLILGQYRVVFFIGFFGDPKQVDISEEKEVYELKADHVRIIDYLILDRGDPLPTSVPDLTRQAGEKVADETQIVIPVQARGEG